MSDGGGERKATMRPEGRCAVAGDESQTTDNGAYQRGRIVWHCSEEDGGPDVGMTLGLGGAALWVGEITRAAHAEGGQEAAALGDDTGWWLMIYPDRLPLAKFVDAESAREFFDHMEKAVRAAKLEEAVRAK